MIKIYSMNTCPDCIYVEEQIQGDDRYEIIDIGSHVKYLKEFLRIRDNSPVLMKRKSWSCRHSMLCSRGWFCYPHTRRSRTYFKTNYRRNVM